LLDYPVTHHHHQRAGRQRDLFRLVCVLKIHAYRRAAAFVELLDASVLVLKNRVAVPAVDISQRAGERVEDADPERDELLGRTSWEDKTIEPQHGFERVNTLR
jgi:hypothetical protein